MLVLSRKLGEKIFIGEDICITVVDIDRGKVRFGIEAPREVAIYREELMTDAQLRAHKTTSPPAPYYFAAPPAAPTGGQS